jgi:signal transduction histidine kinase
MSISGDQQPLWWDPGRRLAHLSETTRRLAERLEARLLRVPDQSVRDTDLEPIDTALAWAAAGALRDAINDAASAGAPPECVSALHLRLDAELRSLTAGAADRLVEEQRTLLEGVSHDIRSPLNSILFLADALLNEHSGALNANQRRQIGVVYGAAVALVRLVNDLIDYTRLSEGAGTTETAVPFNVESVLDDVKRLVAPLLDHHQVSLRVQNEVRVPRIGDPQLVSRLLINLLANAIDAASGGGDVETLFRDDGDASFRIEVTNTGEPPDLVELRRRLNGQTGARELRGRGWTHGLGLSISSRLVRAARGSVSVDCPDDDRTRFTVELPFPAAGSSR